MAAPHISNQGLRRLTGWKESPLGKNIYELHDPAFADDVPGLLIGGTFRHKGRLPATGDATYQAFTASSITSDQLPGVDYSTGEVQAVVEKAQWVIDRVFVTGRSGNTLSLAGSSSYKGKENNFFFIENAPACLTTPGDWMHSSSAGKIYLFSDRHPDTLDIAIPTLRYNVDVDGIADFTIEGLRLEGSSDTAIRGHVSRGLTVRNTEIVNHAGSGIILLTAVGANIEGNLIDWCLVNGISVLNESKQARIIRNTIRNVGMINGASGNGDNKAVAILGASSGMTCLLNRIENVGYIAIRFFGNDNLIERNLIDGYCLRKHDGGAIYCYGSTKGRHSFTNRIIRNNIILNGGEKPLSAAYAIYIDDNSEYISILNNTLVNAPRAGLFIHNSHHIVASGNIVYHDTTAFQFAQNGDNELIRDIILERNTVVSRSRGMAMFHCSTEDTDTQDFGHIDHNTYILLAGQQFVAATKYRVGSKQHFENLTLAQWQAIGFDRNSRVIHLDIPEYTILSEQPNRFDFKASDIRKAFYSGGSAVVAKDPAYPDTYRIAVAAHSPSTTRIEFGYPDLGPVTPEGTYLVRFRAMARSGHQSLIIYARETGHPYRRVSREIYAHCDGTMQQFEFLFRDLRPCDRVSILVECQSDQGDLMVSGFEFREASLKMTDLTEKVRLLYNTTEAPQRIPLSGPWKYPDDTPAGSEVELPSFGGAVLLASDEIPAPEPDPVTKPVEFSLSVQIPPEIYRKLLSAVNKHKPPIP